jgi:hypothetical protein
MEKVQKTSNSECYTPSSEHFRIYLNYSLFQNSVINQETISTLVLIAVNCVPDHYMQGIFNPKFLTISKLIYRQSEYKFFYIFMYMLF